MFKLQDRSNTGTRLMLSADAFLFSGAFFMLTEGLPGIVVDLTGAEARLPDWMQFTGPFLMLASLIAGMVIAWFVHGRGWGRRTWLALLLGLLVGGATISLLITAISAFGRFIPNPLPNEGPWGLVIVTVIAATVFLAVPLFDAVRDLAPGRRQHVGNDLLRLGAFLLIVALVAATVVVGAQGGSELGEAGLFMFMLAAPAAVAVVAMDLFEAWQVKRAATTKAPVHH